MSDKVTIPAKKTYRYLGWTEDQKAEAIALQLLMNKCPEHMVIDQRDHPDVKAAKSKQWAERQKKWKQEVKESVEEASSDYVFSKLLKVDEDEYGLPVFKRVEHRFVKDVDVTVDFKTMSKADKEYLFKKLTNFVELGLAVDVDVEREEKAKAEEEARKAESEKLKAAKK